jgi:hypothetical protein
MPNWVEQDLHVVGEKSDIDAFIRTGLVRRNTGFWRGAGELLFTRLCPLRRTDCKDTYTHESAVVLILSRTRTQAYISLITSWDYPAAFYKRLPKHWPRLAFACAVNEEMGQFGGILLAMNGRFKDCVRGYDTNYDHRQHRREVRVLLKQWASQLVPGRPWRLMPDTPWRHRYMPFDARFEDDGWFYFRTREEMAAFKARYRCRYIMRRVGRTWRRTAIRKSIGPARRGGR